MKNSIVCPFSALLEVIQEDLSLGICYDIKHCIGMWGDNGETRKNIKFYLNKIEFDCFEDLKCSKELKDIFNDLNCNTIKVTVLDCDGCYPNSTEILNKYCNLDVC